MIRSALVLCSGILVAASFACAPAAPPPPAPPITAPCAFDANRIYDLKITTPRFDAQNYGACVATGGNCDALKPVADKVSSYASKIANAINNGGSSAFRNHLCTLDKIYIDTDVSSNNPPAWGMREGKGSTVKHIGIRASILDYLFNRPAGPPGPYASYENQVLGALLSQPPALPAQFSAQTRQWLTMLSYTDANADPANPPTMAIVAILAHEMGHILWVERLQDMAVGCGNPDTDVHNRFFHEHSWQSRGLKFGFHSFGNIDTQNRPKNKESLPTVLVYLNNNDVPNAEKDLRSIYGKGEWASLFATVSPDEDFVETYKLWVLYNGQLQLISSQIEIPSAASTVTLSINVINPLTDPSTVLYKKARWISKCM